MWSLGFGAGLIALGVPVAVCIGLAATLALASTGTPLLVIPQQLFANLNNFGLLAIPFFMLTGAIMDSGGVSKRIIDFSQALVGFIRGGIGHVTIIASMFFADLSGSATADTAAIAAYNRRISADPRLFTTFVQVGDGLSVSVKLRS